LPFFCVPDLLPGQIDLLVYLNNLRVEVVVFITKLPEFFVFLFQLLNDFSCSFTFSPPISL